MAASCSWLLDVDIAHVMVSSIGTQPPGDSVVMGRTGVEDRCLSCSNLISEREYLLEKHIVSL